MYLISIAFAKALAADRAIGHMAFEQIDLSAAAMDVSLSMWSI
jgi:hypothetical protein